MDHVALIYNRKSGQRPGRRAAIIAQVAEVFERASLRVTIIPTLSGESVTGQARAAVEGGCDTVIVCGGDGTVHHVLQALVGTTAALGVIPLGTANALAADLRLPKAAVQAATVLVHARPVRVPIGRVLYRCRDGGSTSRYFIVAAGVGADAYFFSRLDPRRKQRWGYLHYVVEAFRLVVMHSFPVFSARFIGAEGVASGSEQVSQLLAVRIGDFGGLVRKLVPDASIYAGVLKVIVFKTRSRLRLTRFMLAVCMRRHIFSNPIDLMECPAVECDDVGSSRNRTFVEADGELLGTLPARIEVVPDALNLLVP